MLIQPNPPVILYSDPDLICVNKPAGLLSIPDGYHPDLPYLAKILRPDYGKIWIVHRLDRDTSGTILLALSQEIHRALNLQFEHRQVRKIYHAILLGSPEWDAIEVDQPLLVNGDRRHRTVVAPLTGKPAQTKFRILQRFSTACLIEAQPHTGYTHQIRVHLSALGFPILADPLYGKTPSSHLIARTALHAYSISFTHPTSQQVLTLEAPYPDDFYQAISDLQ